MSKVLNLFEATKLLEQYYITSQPQVVARWLREGKIEAPEPVSNKEGWKIEEDKLLDFIEKVRPRLIDIFNSAQMPTQNSFEDEYGIPLQFSNRTQQLEQETLTILTELVSEVKRIREKLDSFQDIKVPNAIKEHREKGVNLKNRLKGVNYSLESFTKLVQNKTGITDFQDLDMLRFYREYFKEDKKLLDHILKTEPGFYSCPITGKKKETFEKLIREAAISFFGLPTEKNEPPPGDEGLLED
ncbi:hypothetical protein [Peribacillus kribbensis]|uniref:hypothetical protein n=1 Tax=Peribacillus kribbensis TaxID=356658 RepID=UPI0003F937E9|nr:hypothetical protein [Peribacillus kribbensis]